MNRCMPPSNRTVQRSTCASSSASLVHFGARMPEELKKATARPLTIVPETHRPCGRVAGVGRPASVSCWHSWPERAACAGAQLSRSTRISVLSSADHSARPHVRWAHTLTLYTVVSVRILWLSVALCGSLWLSVALCGSLWLSRAHNCATRAGSLVCSLSRSSGCAIMGDAVTCHC